MKRMVTVCLLLLFAKSSIAADVPKELKPRYDGLIKSIAKLNIKSYDAYFAEDFSFTDGGGMKFDRSAALKQEENIFKTCESAKCSYAIVKSSKDGDSFIVEVDFKVNAVLKGGSPSSIHEVSTDTWKKVKGTWLIVKRVDSVMEMKG